MGIDKHGLLAIEYAEKTGADFSRVCTIGRQEIQVTKAFYEKILRKTENFDRTKKLRNIHGEIYKEFYENFFKVLFKSKVTDSIDANTFEDASIVHDMNFKLSPSKFLKSNDSIQSYSSDTTLGMVVTGVDRRMWASFDNTSDAFGVKGLTPKVIILALRS